MAVSEIGVSRTRVAEAVAEPTGEAEHVAARPDVDTGEEHPLVGGQLGLEGAADRVHGAVRRSVVGRLGRFGYRRAPSHDEVEERGS